MITKAQLQKFEADIEQCFLSKQIRSPIHLSDGNEDILIAIFNRFYKKGDWIYSNWRSHYHLLCAGADPAWVKAEILAGHSMSMSCKDPKFISSSIVGGLVGQAVGTAWALKQSRSPNRVRCFLGDMSAQTGAFHEAFKYASNFELPILFIIEDNGVSVGSPTQKTWGNNLWTDESLSEPYLETDYTVYYKYKNTRYPHVGAGQFVSF